MSHLHEYTEPPSPAQHEASDPRWRCQCGYRERAEPVAMPWESEPTAVATDPVDRSRRGRSSDRLGKDQERRIERVYGPVKVGEFGRAIDLIGRDFMWQSKASRLPVPKRYPAAGIWPTATRDYITQNINAMTALRSDLMPLLILSWVRHGVRPVDVIYVYWGDWYRLHGELVDEPSQFVSMTGAHFLDVHGRDEPTLDPLMEALLR